MRADPAWATRLGDGRQGDPLLDASPVAIASRHDAARRDRAQARAIRRDALAAKDRVCLGLVIDRLDDFLRTGPFVGVRSMRR